MYNQIGTNIRRAREAMNFTQEYMASTLKIGQNTYSKYETGQSKVSAEMLIKIAGVLKVPPQDLLGETGAIVNLDSTIGTQFSTHNGESNPYQKDLMDRLLDQNKQLVIAELKIAELEQKYTALVNENAELKSAKKG